MRPCVLLILAALVAPLASATELEFEGTPSVKVEVSEGAAQTQPVPPHRAREFGVKVVRSASGYVWASRNNVPLVKHESGAYVTYCRNHRRWLCQSVEPCNAKGASSAACRTAREGVRLHGAHGQSVGVNHVLWKMTPNPSVERTHKGGSRLRPPQGW